MKIVIAVLALVCVSAVASASPLAENEYQMLFTSFIKQHNKVYWTPEHFFERFNIFKTNMDTILRHEAKEGTKFRMKMNQFGDLTNEEFTSRMNNYRRRSLRPNTNTVSTVNDPNLPSSVDWAAQGKVTAVKNQGQCGSCWAFSTTGSIESDRAIHGDGKLVSLSEQELVDCSGSYGNQGCNGGEMQAAFQFVHANGGLCTESAYPYTASDGTCQKSQCQSATTIAGYQNVAQDSSSSLQTAVASQPVSVAVDASGSAWQFYSGGVVTSACGTQLDHGVLAAGYGTDTDGTMYWLVKNSWGASWGENGYIRLERTTSSGSGECGIAMDPSYPTGANAAN